MHLVPQAIAILKSDNSSLPCNSMKKIASCLKQKGLLSLIFLFSFQFHASAATFTVSSLGSSGVGSYRQAVIDANASPGADVIVFTVSGTIMLGAGAPVPSITDPLHIDGTTAPGYIACSVPMITLEGAFAGAVNGIHIIGGASNSIVDAINIRGFELNGIMLVDADSCYIRSCTIGVNSSGWSATANSGNGIRIENGADNNVIGGTGCEGNLISGNSGAGISISGALGNHIEGNTIGLHINGSSPIPNGSHGVSAVNNSHYTSVGGVLGISGNVISGNGSGISGNGVFISASVGCNVRANIIGLDATGSFGIGNAQNGIYLNAANFTVIGGSWQGSGNVIADHNLDGISLNGASNNCLILGNNCGTDTLGTTAVSNGGAGLRITDCNQITIGGGFNFDQNVFSASTNDFGIVLLNASNLLVYGNFIGTDRTGTLNMGNASGGIRFDNGGGSSIIGGTSGNVANTIAYNTGYGIGIVGAGTDEVAIRQNSIYCNVGQGIHLAGQGNTNLAAPIITSASLLGCAGTAEPNSSVEIFYDSTCTATCQGKNYVATVLTNAMGNWSFPAAMSPGTITATVTDGSNNTSEFASCVTFFCTATTNAISPTVCGSYTSPSGNVWTSSNTYLDTVLNSVGCDSIITVDLTVNMPSGSTDAITACDSYVWMNGITYIASNNVSTFTLMNAVGCDSTITLDLIILSQTTATDIISTCDSIYTWIDGVTYTSSNNSATHTITNSLGCDSVITLDLTLSALPNVSLQPFVDVCSNSGLVNLVGASPSGGTYSGPGVVGSAFDPSVTGVGTVNITYTYTDSGGCTGSVIEPLTVITSTTPTLSAFNPVCNTDASFTLTGESPAGGSFAGTGVVNGMFNPSIAGAGVHLVVYSYTDMNGCTGTAQQNITVDDCLSLDDLEAIYLSIAPNPAQQFFSIQSDQEVSDVTLLGLSGRIVQRFNTNIGNYDISTLPTGMYIVRVSIDGQQLLRRLIIQ